MPNYTVQLRRGTSGEHGSFTGAAGEITVNTSNNSVHIHDGSTAGGTEAATKSALDAKTLDNLIDADSDTHVKVEASADSDEIFMSKVKKYLMKINTSINEQDFIDIRASRYRFAQPICEPNHLPDCCGARDL